MFKTKENGNNILDLVGCSKSSCKKEVHSNKCLLRWKKDLKQPNLYLKKIEKEQNESKVSRRKEMKMRA